MFDCLYNNYLKNSYYGKNDLKDRIIVVLINQLIVVRFYLLRVGIIRPKFALDEIKNGVVVSLTSYPKRFAQLHLVLTSLILQSQSNFKLVLTLSKLEIEDISKLPRKIIFFKKYGLEIIFEEGNNLSHKKYTSVIKKYPNQIIITVDDDIIYPKNVVKNLIKTSRINHNCIVANILKEIHCKNNQFEIYSNWPYLTKQIDSSKHYLPIGAGGVLYPSGILEDATPQNFDLVKYTDDLWLKFYTHKKGIKVVKCLGQKNQFYIPIRKYVKMNIGGLNNKNVDSGNNDFVIKKLFDGCFS